MEITFEDLSIELKKRNIRISHQRLKVLDYLIKNRTHPTVDQIYSDLHKEAPSLSKTTIYNTLDTLKEAHLIKVITIEGNETRYDIVTKNHGHFKCEFCRNIYDFDISIDSLKTESLNDFKIIDKDVFFRGICPNCINQEEETND